MSNQAPEAVRLSVGCSVFVLHECPLGACTKDSFKRAGIWGLTEDNCLQELKRHYTNSEHHWGDFRDDEDRDAQVELARAFVSEEVADEERAQKQARHYEKLRADKCKVPKKEAGGKGGFGKGVTKDIAQMQQQLQKLTEAVAKANAARSSRSRSSRRSRSPSRRDDSGSGILVPARNRRSDFALPVSQLNLLRASMVRCKGAANHLKTMNEAAAEAFQREIDTFDLAMSRVVDLSD